MRGEPTRKPAVRKPVVFIGRALDEIRDFPSAARQDAGHQIDLVQCGETPRGSKPMPSVGKGVREIRIAEDDGWFRVFYVADLGDVVYILHGFQKKSNQTPKRAVETGINRYRLAVAESQQRVQR
ncbi:type II toxin-antitoxin system RelE/ParE family toxin [Nocardia farcinica]|uniref:type II toxin-antitoxin system RelE/ParE family toxin n=1 Tax=Nocardia farcinica TaxID=37329 RepID=UPI00209BC94A|nr:type II toxin-antitoxin system RelE/ParE family toxin [Nocardia farcinica]